MINDPLFNYDHLIKRDSISTKVSAQADIFNNYITIYWLFMKCHPLNRFPEPLIKSPFVPVYSHALSISISWRKSFLTWHEKGHHYTQDMMMIYIIKGTTGVGVVVVLWGGEKELVFFQFPVGVQFVPAFLLRDLTDTVFIYWSPPLSHRQGTGNRIISFQIQAQSTPKEASELVPNIVCCRQMALFAFYN